jgi:hypothetical protein
MITDSCVVEEGPSKAQEEFSGGFRMREATQLVQVP